MGLASCRTTFFAQNVIMVTSTKLQKFRIQYLLGLESRSSIPLQKRKKNIIIRDAIITYKPKEEHSPKLLLLYKNYSLINYQNYDQSTGSIQVTLIYTRRTAIWHLCSVHLSTLANREQIWQNSQSCTQLQTSIQIERVCLCIIEQYN